MLMLNSMSDYCYVEEYANKKKWRQIWKNLCNKVNNIVWGILYENVTSIKLFHARGSMK